jgi:hypothetical protein
VLCDAYGTLLLTGTGAVMLPLCDVRGYGNAGGRPRTAPGRDMTVAWSLSLASRALVGTCQLFALVAAGDTVQPVQRNRAATGARPLADDGGGGPGRVRRACGAGDSGGARWRCGSMFKAGRARATC